MNISIKDIIAYEEQKKKQEQQDMNREREYAQVSYEIQHDDEKPEPQKDDQACQVIITSM